MFGQFSLPSKLHVYHLHANEHSAGPVPTPRQPQLYFGCDLPQNPHARELSRSRWLALSLLARYGDTEIAANWGYEINCKLDVGYLIETWLSDEEIYMTVRQVPSSSCSNSKQFSIAEIKCREMKA